MLSELILHGHGLRLLSLERSEVPIHCMASGAGFERRVNEAYSWEGTKRGAAPFALIQHTIAGRGELDFDGTRHALEPGDTMLLSLPHRHRYWLAPGRSWEYFWITLNGREALRIVRALLDAHGPVLRPGSAAVDRLASSCLALLDPALPIGAASAAAYLGLMAMLDGAASGSAEPVPLPTPILRTRRHIEQNLAGNLSVERLAGIAQLSRAHFVRQFTLALGRPPSDYVLAQRMARAERLLIATDSSIGEIAKSCGFASANYFAKAFRRHHALTPGAFRAMAHKGEG